MTTQKNASEFYRSDLSHAVSTLGAAIRSLDRMERFDISIPLAEKRASLLKELIAIREEEKNATKK
ncbi:hypothetical protein D3C71_1356620 [compost metagenome]